MPLVVKCDNSTVTDTYLEIIGEALSNLFDNIRYTNKIEDALKESKNEMIVVARTIDAFKLITRGYKKVVIWFQGVEPEESYMKHQSKIRFLILSFMEKLILKKSYFRYFVSNEMRRHYEKKYNLHFEENDYYCMPCMNTELHSESFQCTEKYQKNTFAYVGSLAAWQKFEETVRVYKAIESEGFTDCILKVFTTQKEEADKILKNNGVQHYSIEYVSNEELPKALSSVKYGFILRENTTVNRVATPTKISTYLSCGLIPIYSECLVDFAEQAKDMRYAIMYDNELLSHINNLKYVNKEDILKEYTRLFDNYYSRKYHVNHVAEKLKKLI